MSARLRAWPIGLLLALAANASAQAPVQTESQRRIAHILQAKTLGSHQSIQTAWKDIESFSSAISSGQKAVDDAVLGVRRDAIGRSTSAESLTRALDKIDANTRESRALFAALFDIQRDILNLTGETYDWLLKSGKLRKDAGKEPAFDAPTDKFIAEKKVLLDALIVRERNAEGALRKAGMLPYDP